MTKYQIVAFVLFVGTPILMFVFWRIRKTPGLFDEVFPVNVRGECGLGELIHDANVDVRTPGISEFHVSISHNRCVNMQIYGIPERNAIAQVLNEIDSLGFLPGNTEEMLSFLKRYPKEIRRYRIWALGAKADLYGRKMVMCASRCRGVSALTYADPTIFNRDDAFLVIPKCDRPLK
jgi:hypothetical protein